MLSRLVWRSLALALALRRITAVVALLLANPKGAAQLLQAQRVIGQLLVGVALVHVRQLQVKMGIQGKAARWS